MQNNNNNEESNIRDSLNALNAPDGSLISDACTNASVIVSTGVVLKCIGGFYYVLEDAKIDGNESAVEDKRESAEPDRRENAEQIRQESAEPDKQENTERDKRENAELDRRQSAEQVRRQSAEQVRRQSAEPDKRENAEQVRRESIEPDKRENAELDRRENTEPDKREKSKYDKLENDERERQIDQRVIECRARGKFRLDGVSPRAGDRVRFEAPQNSTTGGYLTEIFARKSLLVRPPVANATQFVLVLSASKPRPDLLLADKLLIQAERIGIKTLIVINKTDIADENTLERVQSDYAKLPYKFIAVSAKKGENMAGLKDMLRGELSCFAGQSAVGKSSLINSLCKKLNLETGGMSRKTGRGRHTTRVAELLPLEGENNSYIIDTPGFSLLDIESMEPEDLGAYYPELSNILGKCRFDDCMHKDEPGCYIPELLQSGDMSKGRYERYLIILSELIEAKQRRYS